MKDENVNLTEKKFQAAVDVIKGLPKDGPYQPSHDMMLKFYGLYKQATLGPCTEPKPSFFDVVKGYKWKAWSSLGNMSKEDAKNSYVDELKKIVETMSYSDNVAAFIQTLGPFYEYVDFPTLKGVPKNGIPDGIPDSRNFSHVPSSSNFDNNTLERATKSINGHTNGMEDHSNSELVDDSIHAMRNDSRLKPASHSDTESDDDEYSDPAESIVASNPVPAPALSSLKGNSCQPSNLALTGLTGGVGNIASGSRASRFNSSDRRLTGSDYVDVYGENGNGFMTGGDGDGSGRPPNDYEGDGSNPAVDSATSQVLSVLRRIQRDIEVVAHRIDALEIQSVYQHQQLCSSCRRNDGIAREGRGWCIFPELSARSTLLLLSWPVVVGGAAALLRTIRNRRFKSS